MTKQGFVFPRPQIVREQELAVDKQREKKRWRLPADHKACLICGWDDPLSIDKHHIGKHFLGILTLPVCKNHHIILSAKQEHRRKLMQDRSFACARPLACLLHDAADFVEALGNHAGFISPEDEAAIEILRSLGDWATEDGAEGEIRVEVSKAVAWFSTLVSQIAADLPADKCLQHHSVKMVAGKRRPNLVPRIRLSPDDAAECDLMPIYVRTIPLPDETEPKTAGKGSRQRRTARITVVFDTETTICQALRLRAGAYQVFDNRELIQSGFFYGSAFSESELELLRRYTDEHGMKCLSRAEFVRGVLFHFGLKFRARIVGFNLPFDLSRLAIDWGNAQDDMFGGFSFKLDENRFYPRLRIKKLGTKSNKIEWGSAWDGKTHAQRKADKEKRPDKFTGSFIDVSTLAFSLHSRAFSLEFLCNFLQIPGKSKIEGHGRTLDRQYLDYLMEDVRATTDCFFKLEDQLSALKLKHVYAEALYSPASLGKGYLSAMNIRPWRECQPDLPADVLTAIMNTFYGARSEVRHRRQVVQVRHCDFMSMYPTVFVLMGLWKLLTSEGVDYADTTDETRRFVDRVTLDQMFDPRSWKHLISIVEIRPNRDAFPVRGLYGAETTSIGMNHLISNEPQWYSLADIVASKVTTGRTPDIVRAITFTPRKMQRGLKPVDIFGDPGYRVDPAHDDFFQRVIDLRSKLKMDLSIAEQCGGKPDEVERLGTRSEAMKTLANSTAYGIYVEINVTDVAKKKAVNVILDGPDPDRIGMTALEKPGRYFHPLVGTITTAAARLMLAMSERLAIDSGLGWAFCDTDSMPFTPCEGMSEADFHQRVDELQARFLPLNPYADKGPLFQTEKENYGLDECEEMLTNAFVPLYCYAICPKRYCLFNLRPDGSILMRKISEHGLGYLMPPYEDGTPIDGIPVKPKSCKGRQWHHDLWHQIVRAEIDGHPDIVDLSPLPGMNNPAMSQWRVSAPELLDQVQAYNSGREPDECIRPYNFLSGFMIREQQPNDDWIGPSILNATPKSPFRHNPAEAASLCFDSRNGKPILRHFLKTYREALSEHHLGNESKFHNGIRSQSGITTRRTIIAQGRVYIGKEGNKLNPVEGEDDGLIDDPAIKYGGMTGDFSYVISLLREAVQSFSMNNIANRLGISRWTLRDVIGGVQAPSIQLVEDASEMAKWLRDERLACAVENDRRIIGLRDMADRLGMNEVARRLGITGRYIRTILSGRRKLNRKLAWTIDAVGR